MFEIDGKKIANNIRAERNRVNLSQEETAKCIGITSTTYKKMEKDCSNLKIGYLIKLAETFKCKIDNFFV